MTTFMEPATIDIPIELVPPAATCPADHDWCEGDCTDGPDGYHSSKFAMVSAQRWGRHEGWQDTEVWTSVYVHDEVGQVDPMVCMLVDDFADEVRYTPEQARKQAAALLNAADTADPLPSGVLATSPELLHLGDELLTNDGWQTITGLMFFADSDPTIQVFTNERDVDSGDGWPFEPEDLVQIRRRIHGSCAIQFVEPFPAVGGTK